MFQVSSVLGKDTKHKNCTAAHCHGDQMKERAFVTPSGAAAGPQARLHHTETTGHLHQCRGQRATQRPGELSLVLNKPLAENQPPSACLCSSEHATADGNKIQHVAPKYFGSVLGQEFCRDGKVNASAL
ncbi:unnamed protein product [Pleuronectes platessa]|uniref:Uncharacterized protein n=1 Tax=Pleuronectes platessa TaxID=8262 RepID=A0A9N7TYZ6_PLEPL|nr:unnamed protein product [Pleuronectes platessa]